MLNAVCVPADLQYVAKIRCDQDDVHSSWAAATAASSTNTPPTHPHKHGLEEDSGGGDHCCCNSPRSTASGAENMGNNKLGLANADSNCNSLYIDKQQDRTMHHTNIPYLLPLNAGQFQYQNTYQQNCCDIGFHSQTFPIPQEPSSMPLSSQSGCELPGLDSNSGFYTGSISCYASSSSESSGDSSSPGYDASTFCTFESVLANLDISNLDNPQTQSQNDSFLSMLGSSSVKNLKDLTNTFNVKREVVQCPTACSYVTATESTWESAKEPHLSSQNAVASSYQENAGINPNSFDANLDEFASQTYPFLDGGDEMQVFPGKGMPDRRLRRREQNRQAARRCRQRKKEQGQELIKEYYQLLSANSEMQSRLKLLETEKQRLLHIYDAHVGSCIMQFTTESERC